MTQKLDSFDLKILAELQANGGLSNQEVAERVGLSPSPCSRRIRELGLHRLEANVQPGNRRSIALVEGLGFRREGKVRGFLKIGNRWRDHERWALLKYEWRSPSARAQARA